MVRTWSRREKRGGLSNQVHFQIVDKVLYYRYNKKYNQFDEYTEKRLKEIVGSEGRRKVAG